MKELIIGDCHFGTHSNNTTWLNWQIQFFTNQLIPYIKSHRTEISRIVFVGDLFDIRYSINELIGIEVKSIVRELAETGIEDIYFVAGNHDYYSPLANLMQYNAYELAFGEEFSKQYSNVHFVTEEPMFCEDDGALFLPWYYTEEPELWEQVCNQYKGMIKKIYCHTDLNGWSAARCAACGNPYVFSGHIHQSFQIKELNLYNLGSMFAFDFSDTGDCKYFYIFEDGNINRIENIVTPKFKRFYNEEIFEINASDVFNSIVQLCVSEDNINKARYIEQIKALKSRFIDVNMRVNVIDGKAIEADGNEDFNQNIENYIDSNMPDHLTGKYKIIKKKMETPE